jgi:AhpD family alkylhydroperoxidase
MTMSSPPSPDSQATPEAAQLLFDKIRKGLGKVPNAYQLIGAHSTDSLSLLLTGDAALSKGSLSRPEIKAIRLAFSAQNGCDYCVAAHVAAGKAAGLSLDELRHLVAHEDTGHAGRDALVRFAREVAARWPAHGAPRPRPWWPQFKRQAIRQAKSFEALMTVSLISFTNLVNRVNDTVVDFPKIL